MNLILDDFEELGDYFKDVPYEILNFAGFDDFVLIYFDHEEGVLHGVAEEFGGKLVFEICSNHQQAVILMAQLHQLLSPFIIIKLFIIPKPYTRSYTMAAVYLWYFLPLISLEPFLIDLSTFFCASIIVDVPVYFMYSC